MNIKQIGPNLNGVQSWTFLLATALLQWALLLSVVQADDYMLSMSPWRYIPNNGPQYETIEVASGSIGIVAHMYDNNGPQARAVRIVERPFSSSGPLCMDAKVDVSHLDGSIMASDTHWGPYSNNAYWASVPISVTANIERTSSPSGDQTLKGHWQLPTSGYLGGNFEARRIIEMWVQSSNGNWYLCDWVTLTVDLNYVYVLRDPSNSNYWYGNLSGQGKTIHLYEYGYYYGPMADGSGVSNGSNPSTRPGGIEINPRPSCPTCDEYSAISPPQFDHSSYTPPDQQASCIQSITGSLNLQIGMGQVGFGKIGGRLRLYSAHPSENLLNPNALKLDAAEGHETIRDADSGSVLQYVSAATIVDIVSDTGGNGYRLNFYHRAREAKREGESGPFEVLGGEPFMTMRFESADGVAQAGEEVNNLRITRSAGASQEVVEYRYDANLETWRLIKEGGNHDESVRTIQSDDLETYTKERTISDQSGETQVHVVEQWARLICGDRKVRETVDPEGAALTTTWEYYTDVAQRGSLGQIKQVVRSSGHWTRYQYDRFGRRTKTITQYLDAPVGATEGQCAVSEVIYAEVDPDNDNGLRETHIERLLGQEVSRSFVAFRNEALEEIEPHVPGAAWDAPQNLITRKTHFTEGPFRGELRSVVRPDGTASIYDYELDGEGLLDSTQLTKTVLTGEVDLTAENGNGNGNANANARRGRDNNDDGNGNDNNLPVIRDGTRSTALSNNRGNTIAYQSEDLRSGTELSSWVATRIDAFGRVEEKTHADGTTETTSFGCCHVETTKNREDITTTYAKLGNRSMRSRLGMGDYSEVTGRSVRTGRIGTDGKEVTERTVIYDLAGRVIQETDALGRVTTYTFATNENGHRLKTTTLPDGNTRIRVTYPDGQLLRSYGTAVHPVRYEYGMASPGDGLPPQRYRKRITLNVDGSDSGQWTMTFTDSRGRAWRTLRSYKEDQPAITSHYYDRLGRTIRTVNADGVTTLQAHFKEEDGGKERTVRALDMNRNGIIDYDGSDRITETITELVQLNDEEKEQRKTSRINTGSNTGTMPDLIRRTTTKVWTSDGDGDTTRIVRISESTLDGEQFWQMAGDRQTTSYQQDQGPGIRKNTTIAADGSRTVVQTENHREVLRQSFHPSGELASSTTTEYDDYQRITSQVTTDSDGNVFASRHLTYDTLGRIIRTEDHEERVVTHAYNADNSVATTTITVNGKSLTTNFTYDALGRRTSITRPDGKKVRTTYWPTGEKRREQGAGTYTASYAYTDQGQLKTLTTEAGDTHWQYDLAGTLQRKTYLDGNHTDYEYTPGGKLRQRTSARGIVTSYRYNGANELEHVEYSDDSTASITYGYNRLGQNRNVVHGNTTYLNEYSDEGALTRQLISGGPLHGTILEQQFDDQGRRTQFKAGLPHQQNVVHNYSYDDRGRMTSVRQDERSAHYTYDDQSGALVSTRFQSAGVEIAETAREFDTLGRLAHISTRSLNQHGDFYQSFDYSYNDTNQRTRVETEDGSYWAYRYDDLGQVISAKRHWKDGTPAAGQQFEYDFDGIGNRKAARYGGDTEGKNLAEIRYTNGDDDATQIGTIEHPGTTYVTGSAHENAEVTVNSQPTERQGTYFSNAVETDNSAGASIESISIDAREGAETDSENRKAFIPARTTQFRYDPDGNLLFDGRWHYGWNGENRLIEMRSADVKGGRKLKLEFRYDYLGRRIGKRVTETIDGKTQVAKDQSFLYDGWNLVAELDTTGRAHRTHLWGLDLSGTPQGAGGVGGLISTANLTTDQAVFISFDGNGNVSGELECDFGRTVTTTSYDAFGNVATQTGESVSSFTFSTKFLDAEANQLYYGLRYYNPHFGGWLNRDPIGEAGGNNLYGLIGNDGINQIDVLGLAPEPHLSGISAWVKYAYGEYKHIDVSLYNGKIGAGKLVNHHESFVEPVHGVDNWAKFSVTANSVKSDDNYYELSNWKFRATWNEDNTELLSPFGQSGEDYLWKRKSDPAYMAGDNKNPQHCVQCKLVNAAFITQEKINPLKEAVVDEMISMATGRIPGGFVAKQITKQSGKKLWPTVFDRKLRFSIHVVVCADGKTFVGASNLVPPTPSGRARQFTTLNVGNYYENGQRPAAYQGGGYAEVWEQSSVGSIMTSSLGTSKGRGGSVFIDSDDGDLGVNGK